MNKFQYKEKDYAEEILKSGFTSKYIATELKILAKYYKQQGKDETEIKELLETFCGKNLTGYNKAIHFKIINNAVNQCINDKNKLIQIDKIDITKNELKVIDSMNISHDYKRVVFTLLVLTKLGKQFLKIRDGEIKNSEYYFGGHKNYRELVTVSKIIFNKTKKSTVKNIHDLIHMLNEQGIVEITNNANIRLSFMYGIEQDQNIEFSVIDYSVIGLYYDLYHGENRVKECQNCNVPIKINGKYKKYCNICADTINKQKTLDNYYKKRNF
ncbi:hypothetical protein [Metabacillus fastidiosus]|uniref:hypothetical protein n=1 Tax=Metabacillus fastidiosus TaxID=1458 RepID=UPI003D2A64F6